MSSIILPGSDAYKYPRFPIAARKRNYRRDGVCITSAEDSGVVPVAPGSPDSYWAMDSLGATTPDSLGGRPLTSNGTPALVAGKMSSAISCAVSGGADWLSSSDASFNFGNTDFVWRFWVKVTTVTAQDILKRFFPGGYRFQYDVTQGIGFYCTDGTSQATVYSGQLMVADTWYMVVGFHDATNNLIGISVDGGTIITAAYSAGCGTSPSELVIGANALYIIIDEVGVWTGLVFDQGNVAFEWNDGAGVTYS